MKKLIIVFIFILIIEGADAMEVDVNDSIFDTGISNITLTNTHVDSISCCDVNILSAIINGSNTTYFTSSDKIITNPQYNPDNFLVNVSGLGYFNFSITMEESSVPYKFNANGVFIEIKNSYPDKTLWFNYTGNYPVVIEVSRVNTISLIINLLTQIIEYYIQPPFNIVTAILIMSMILVFIQRTTIDLVEGII